MAQPSRLAALPGYDTAPDIYETAETDDVSTTLTSQTSQRSPSETDETTDEEENEESYGVSRRRLYPERARQRFRDGAGKVDAKGVDLSDRIDGKRKGYGLRRRTAEEIDEDEGLEARIARLRREIEECKAESEREQAQDGEDGKVAEDVDELARLLASIDAPSSSRSRSRAVNGVDREPPVPPEPDGEGTDEQTLTHVADFDTRLSALEHALGLSSLDAAGTGPDAIASPLLPSLNILDQQLSALSSAASLSGLEAARSRVQKLRSEADAANTKGAEDDEETVSISADDLEKLQSLYQLIPTLSSLAPTVPALLARLRSLRTLHATAANAGSDLDEIEGRQRELETELKEWREGLEQVEGNVQKAAEANGRNGKFVEDWVKELMGRVETLGR